MPEPYLYAPCKFLGHFKDHIKICYIRNVKWFIYQSSTLYIWVPFKTLNKYNKAEWNWHQELYNKKSYTSVCTQYSEILLDRDFKMS